MHFFAFFSLQCILGCMCCISADLNAVDTLKTTYYFLTASSNLIYTYSRNAYIIKKKKIKWILNIVEKKKENFKASKETTKKHLKTIPLKPQFLLVLCKMKKG